jgi:hypothetical protein
MRPKTTIAEHGPRNRLWRRIFLPHVDKINAAIAEFQEPALREKINIEINGVSLGPCEIKPGPSLVVPGKPLVGKCEDCGVEIRKGTFFSCDLVGRLLCKKCFDIENARPEAPKA